jgi:hypothetical protein
MVKKLIGLYQLITGIFGIIIIVVNYLGKNTELINSEILSSQVVTGVLLYGLLAWMGYGLLNDYSKAKTFSIFLQTIQIPIIFSEGVIYKFTSAGYISIGISNNEFAYRAALQPIDFSILTNSGTERIYMVYLIPVILLIGLIKSK